MVLFLFVYGKLNAYETHISPKYSKLYNVIKSIYKPVLKFLGPFFKPFKVGEGVFLDMTQIMVLIILLLILMR